MPHDLACLDILTEDDIIDTIYNRAKNNIFYTLAGPVLLSFNHFIDSNKEIIKYTNQEFGDENTLLDTAHLYLFLMKIYHQLCQQRSSHSIIICGLSGSGKSSLFKDTLHFLSNADELISNQLSHSCTILSTILTTPTITNSYTTRSSLQAKVFFDNSGKYRGVEFYQSGLELTRVPMIAPNKSENNFNLFYFLLYGENSQVLDKWKISPLKEYLYLPLTKGFGIDYSKRLQDFKDAIFGIGEDNDTLEWIFKIIAIILHIGALKFIKVKAKSPKKKEKYIQIENMEEFTIICQLLELECSDTLKLTFENSKNISKAENLRDSFAMILYSFLCDYIIDKINNITCNNIDKPSMQFINLIDVYGCYEQSTELGLREFLVNYTNEKLRKVFYQNLLENSPVEFQDNEACVQLSENICEILRNQKSSSVNIDTFSEEIQNAIDECKFGTFNNDSLKIEHYFGNVSYCIKKWLPLFNICGISQVKKLIDGIKTSSLVKQSLEFIDITRIHEKLSGIYHLDKIFTLVKSFQGTTNHFIYCLRGSIDNKEDNFKNILHPQLYSHGIVELAEISQYTQKTSCVYEYSNTFPGSSSKKKRKKDKKKKKRANTSFSKRNSGSKNITLDDSIENPIVTVTAAESPRRRSRSIKHRIRPKSKTFKNNDVLKTPINNRKFVTTSSSLTTQSLLQSESTKSIIKRSNSDLNVSLLEDSSDSEGSLILSDDELSDISEDDIENENIFIIPPDKKILLDTKIFSERLELLSKENNDNNIIEKIEYFIWKQDKDIYHIINNVEMLHYLTQKSFNGDKYTKITEEELITRRDKFFGIYKCGTLLRMFYQREAKPFNTKLSQANLGELYQNTNDSSLITRSTSEGSISRISKVKVGNSSSILNRLKQEQTLSPRFSDDDSEDENNIGISEDDQDKDWIPEVNWNIPNKVRRNSIHLSVDKVDDIVNQINFSNPIKASPRKRKTMIDFNNFSTQSYSFVNYAQSHFNLPKKMTKLKPGSSKYKAKLKKLTSATKEPISTSLLFIRSITLNDIAVANFKHILFYMNGKFDQPVSNIRNPFSHAKYIIRNGLEKNSLRDEIYSQLMKQATNNLKEKFLIRIWELLAYCTGCFCPSPYFQKYLIKFFDNTAEESGDIGAWASFCKDRLLKVEELGKRFFVPTETELLAVQQRKPLIQVFYFIDGKQKQIPVYSSTTATEALEFLLQMVGLKDTEGYMIYERFKITNLSRRHTDTVERSLLYSEVLCNSLSKFEELKDAYSDDIYQVETTFIIKRKLFLEPRKMPTDPVEINLQFYQASQTIRKGLLLVTEKDAEILVPLEQQAIYGDWEQRSFRAKDLFPENIRHHKIEILWKKEVNDRHKALKGISKENAKQMYLQYCTQLPFYGFCLFPVRHSSKWKMPMDIYIAIHHSGIFFVSASKEVYYSFSFLQVTTHTATPYSLQIGFENNEHIEVRTNSGDEIISLILDYKYYEFSKEIDS